MSSPQPELDRHGVTAIAILLFVAVFVNLDRFVLGPSGPLRAHDVADHTVTGLASCGEFWRSSLGSVWDASQMRGWPRSGSAQHPQGFMCVIAGATPLWLISPILHTILLAVMAIGTFLFVLCFLRRSQGVAVAGAVLQLTLFFFFHEHPSVVNATLLPALLGFLSVPAYTRAARLLLVGGAALVMALANPPGTAPLMPLAHLALIFAAPRSDRRRHVVRWTAFWCVYGLYYAPTLIAQLREFGNASRSLYRSGPATTAFLVNLKEMLLNPAVISPAAVFVALVNRRTWRGTLLFFLAIVGGVALCAANQVLLGSDLGRRFPILVSMSTTYYRMYYFVPVGVLLWATWLWQDAENASTRTRVWRALGIGMFCLAVAYPLSDTNRVFGPYWRYAVVLGLSMGLGVTWWTRRAWTMLLVVGSIVLFSRYEYTQVYEVATQGNLFLEEPHFGLPATLSRTVTVMNTCDAVDLFPAQARAAGEETLDGISNFYDRSFAERWRYFVADNPALCTARYAGWPTRAELTLGDLAYASDRILPWLWINNVEFVRSAKPLDYPELQLVSQRAFVYDNVQHVTRYLYRLRHPVSRVFTLPEPVARRAASPDLFVEEAALSDLMAHGGLSNVDAQAVDGSHLRFTGTFDSGQTVVANMNYHRGWTLRVDGQPSRVPIEPGPFGMIGFRPVEGSHEYELEFHSPETLFIPLCMLAALGLLWVGSDQSVTRRLEAVRIFGTRAQPPDARVGPARRVFVRWVTAGLFTTALGLAAAAVLRRRLVDPKAVWFDGDWLYRLPLRTHGARQTAPLTGFPLRIECTSADVHFWSAVQPSGADIRFADASGQRLLPLEVEEFDRARQRLVAWVQVPELATGPQMVAYLYYGNPKAAAAVNAEPVWDAHYEGVWHMNPRKVARDGVLADSTGHARVGIPRGVQASSDDVARGIAFDGRGGAIEVADWPGLQSARGDWTVEFWIQHAPLKKRNFGLIEHGSAGAFHLYLHNEGFLVLERHNDNSSTEKSLHQERIPPSAWTAIAITRTRQHIRIAVDGVTGSAQMVTPDFLDGAVTAPLRFGVGAYGPLEGRLAEVRISRGVARSADWILASFRSQFGSFVEMGAPEHR